MTKLANGAIVCECVRACVYIPKGCLCQYIIKVINTWDTNIELENLCILGTV